MSHHGEYKVPGGKLVVADFRVVAGRLADVRITGDFFLFPDEAIHVIAAALNGAPVEALPLSWAERIRAAIAADVEMLGFGPDDVAEAIRRGLP
jgi:lipoate-protein ligase A